ncbi:MAG: type VI secretion system tube protein Hcp [Planctomycetaceae bacterium]|nr:type VI secretion system tube protein Hcp [Planctomycetaceae bacterium]MCP4478598.1 type VI secretion system tube protein Hcp [Planctomycetaceae bacterium]MCP4773974.1 type VI secretion system tube protein Hcp [Planctomycetaceae bacterium]
MGVFAKLDGYDGQCPVEGFDNHIELLSSDFGIHKPASAGGRAGGGGAAVADDIMMVIDYEKAMPAIQKGLLNGKAIKKVEVKLTTTLNDNPNEVYLTYTFEDCHFTSMIFSAAGSGGEPPTVSISISYTTIECNYIHFDEKGKKKNVPASKFNVRTGKDA